MLSRLCRSLSIFASSAESCAEGRDASVEVVIAELIEPLGDIGRHLDRLAPATVKDLFGGSELHLGVRVVQPFADDIESTIAKLSGAGREPLWTTARVPRLAGLERHCSGLVFKPLSTSALGGRVSFWTSDRLLDEPSFREFQQADKFEHALGLTPPEDGWPVLFLVDDADASVLGLDLAALDAIGKLAELAGNVGEAGSGSELNDFHSLTPGNDKARAAGPGGLLGAKRLASKLCHRHKLLCGNRQGGSAGQGR